MRATTCVLQRLAVHVSDACTDDCLFERSAKESWSSCTSTVNTSIDMKALCPLSNLFPLANKVMSNRLRIAIVVTSRYTNLHRTKSSPRTRLTYMRDMNPRLSEAAGQTMDRTTMKKLNQRGCWMRSPSDEMSHVFRKCMITLSITKTRR